MSESRNDVLATLSDELQTSLNTYAHVTEQPIAWGDMDAFRHVNNVVFYRYSETARIEYLHALDLFRADTTTVLAKSSCTYLSPVVYPDTLFIGVQVTRLGTTSLTMQYAYFSSAQNKQVASGEAVLVRLNSEGNAKSAWTKAERQAILALEKQVGNQPEV